MTSEEDDTSNECSKEKEDAFEEFLYQEFKALEQDYDKVSEVVDKFKNQNKPR